MRTREANLTTGSPRKETAIKDTARIRRRILSHQATIGVLGQGYVGLSLTCVAADVGFTVFGVDIDEEKVAALARGESVVAGVREGEFRAGIASERITFTTDADVLNDCDVILICVPTPLRDGAPDLSFVIEACRIVAQHLSHGCLVVLESTTYPGTTEELVAPLLEEAGHVAGRDVLLAYSPERIDPGNDEFGLRDTPKLVGGVTPESVGVASLFYGQLVDKVLTLSSARAAELTKLLENAFRHVNIALVNEMAMICHDMEIDVWEVLEAASTKPFGFMSFSPGPGVGGHCIPLDSTYLAWQVRRDAGRQFRVLEQAEDINSRMPGYVAARIGDGLSDAGLAVKRARILVLGVTYKAGIDDVRESPSVKVINHLQRRGATVSFHDPYVADVAVNGGTLTRTALTQRAVAESDCVAILTPHQTYDFAWIADNASLVFDARNALGSDRRDNVIRL